MHADDLRAYAQRPWHVLAALEQDHWARELATRGPLATLEASQALWAHMRRVRPDWPTEADRRADLAHHVVLKQAIDRAAGVFLAAARRCPPRRPPGGTRRPGRPVVPVRCAGAAMTST